MKFSHVLALSSFVAASFGFVACGDDSSSSPAEEQIESSSSGKSSSSIKSSDSKPSSSESADEKLDCTVKGGVKVVLPKAGDTFKMGDTIRVVFGSDLEDSGYNIVFKVDEEDPGWGMFDESVGPTVGDGKTCYEFSAVLTDEFAEPTNTAIVRVEPYNSKSKAGLSATFKVTK